MARNEKKTETGCFFGNLYGIVIRRVSLSLIFQKKMETSMKATLVFFIFWTLFCTLGCNYDYGKYGKDKKETNAEKTK